MLNKNKPYIFTVIYVLLCLFVMNLLFEDNKTLQLYCKPFIPITLFLFYFFSVKKINYYYVLMLISILIGHLFMIFPQKYFIICLCSYLAFHLLATSLVYKKFLVKKSSFNVFTFSLPFFMSFLTIFLLIYKNLSDDLIPVFLFGTVAAVNGAVVLLNYSQKQNITNYLIFIGLFTVIAADASVSIYKYSETDIIFYYLLVLLDQIGQYAFCRGLILKHDEEEKLTSVNDF